MQRKRFNGRLEDAGAFRRRRFCSISCATFRQHATEPPTVAAARKRAHKRREEGCEACGVVTECDVHHIDGDPMNNVDGNLQSLCPNCHAFWHAALKRSGRLPKERMPRLFR
jgi:hypothetical protein